VALIFVHFDRPSLIFVGPSKTYPSLVFRIITSGKTSLVGQDSYLLIGDKGTRLGFDFGIGIYIVWGGSLHVTLLIGLHPQRTNDFLGDRNWRGHRDGAA